MNRKTTKNRAYTLIEIIVVAAIISLVVGSWLFVTVSSEKSGKKEDISQEYYRQLIWLQSSIKRDLRSALKVNIVSSKEFTIKIITDLTDEGPITKDVQYVKAKNGRLISRIENGKTQIWDFTIFPKTNKFTLELIMPTGLQED